jgi:cytochrome c peroxidase
MKKYLFLIILSVVAIGSMALVEITYNYNSLNFNPSAAGTPYTYALSPTFPNMPRDIDVTTDSLAPGTAADTLRNMDNEPYSIGLNGQRNFTTNAGATLGRVIFYDRDLSVNHSIACGDCHKQKFSFTDTARLSYGWQGPTGPRTGRNSMNLNHIRFHKAISMYWDMRAASIEDQVWRPMHDPVEMGMSLNPVTLQVQPSTVARWDTIKNRMNAKSFYPILFQKAFGSTLIDSQRIVMALAQFVRTMNTFDSKWRRAMNTNTGNPSVENLRGLNQQELLGRNLFMDVNRGNCQACHTRNIFVNQGAQNNGLDGSIFATTDGGRVPYRNSVWLAQNGAYTFANRVNAFNDYNGKDSGLGGWKYWFNRRGGNIPDPNNVNDFDAERGTTNSIGFIGRMAVPSLINIAVTAPYMHDGRYKTLDEVINFYSDSVKNSDYNTLSGFLRKIDPQAPINEGVKGKDNVSQAVVDTSPVQVIHYSTREKAALKAFLLTMTDSTILTDPRWGNPFTVVAGVKNTKDLKPVMNIEASSQDDKLVIEVVNGKDFNGSILIYDDKDRLVRRKSARFALGNNFYKFDDLKKSGYTIIIRDDNKTIMDSKQI